MTFLSNIQSVAKYESKLLIRSWFFRVFTVLAIGITTLFNFLLFVSEDTYGFWIAMSIPSNIPYLILLLLNTGQAVIAIFLASDFLKRDKKLDTSEVFYVRPLSNAEYVIGKIWGNLRVFLLLNLIIMGITMAFNLTVGEVDWIAYLLYFLLISVPTLVFIIGLSLFFTHFFNFAPVPGGLTRYELTLFFSIFVFLQFWNMFNAKAFGNVQSAFDRLASCKGFLWVTLIILAGQILIVSLGGALFSVTPLQPMDWVYIFVATSAVLWIGEIYRLIRRWIA